jgi:hypothetical protein
MSDKRYDLGGGDTKLDTVTFPLWHYGVVIDIEDPYDAGRIRVRIEGVDNDVPQTVQLNDPGNGGLPWCQPLLPKFINVVPKVGEVVKIAVFDYRNKKLRREYIGPAIAQQRPPDFIESPYFPTKLRIDSSTFNGAWSKEPESIDGDWKIYADKDDIAITGRRNTDFILRNKTNYDEVILRAGKIDYLSIVDNQGTQNDTNVLGGSFKLNKKNPAYITINHTLPQTYGTDRATNKKLNLDKDRTHVNVVADKVNLISHEGSSKKGFPVSILKGDDVLTQIKTENEKLHPLIYGDMVWEFMTKMRAYVEGHIHKGSRREPDGDPTKNDIIKWFNDNMGTITEKESPDGTKFKEIENCRFLSKGVKTN